MAVNELTETIACEITAILFKINCFLSFPENLSLSANATEMMRTILISDQNKRPTAQECFFHSFFSNYFIPDSLPDYCLYTKPQFDVSPYHSKCHFFGA